MGSRSVIALVDADALAAASAWSSADVAEGGHDLADLDLIPSAQLVGFFVERAQEDACGGEWLELGVGGFQPGGDELVPGVEVLAFVLELGQGSVFFWGAGPPGGVVSQELNGLGPELVAVVGDGFGVAVGGGDGPEASVAIVQKLK